MDKKVKRKLDVLHQRLHKVQQQLSGARQQRDEVDEVERLEREIKTIEAEIQKLKG